jgi:hypothetical protein
MTGYPETIQSPCAEFIPLVPNALFLRAGHRLPLHLTKDNRSTDTQRCSNQTRFDRYQLL